MATATQSPHTDLRRPPGLPRGFFFGSSLDILKNPLGFFSGLAKKFPDIASYFLLWNPNIFLLSHPDHIRRVLVANQKNYVKDGFYDPLQLLLGKGLLTSEGSFWFRQRRLAQPAFHREKIAAFGSVMTETALEKVAVLEEAVKSGRKVNLHALMTGVAFRVVYRTLLGHEQGADEERIYRVFNPALSHINRLMFGIWNPPLKIPTPGNLLFRYRRGILRKIVKKVIGLRQAEGATGGDLVSLLLQVRDEDTGEGMSAAQLEDEVMTTLLAGFETTANALTWTFHLLATHPEVEKKLRDEIRSVTNGRAPSAEDMPRLSYTLQVINESLRLYPPVWAIGRRSVEADVFGECEIPGGSIAILGVHMVHRDGRFWEDPERFDPDRFSPERFTEKQKRAFMPFSAGPRICIGNNFALMEMALVLAVIVPRFRFRHVAVHRVRAEAGVTLRPRGGLWMFVARAAD